MKKSVIAGLIAFCAVTIGVLGVRACQFVRDDNLNQAALAGDLGRCMQLVENGADVNGPGMHGMRSLMSAAKGGSLETVEFLVSNGADVNSNNDSGSALMWAVDAESVDSVRYLLDSGADSGWTSAMGDTALSLASSKGNEEITEVLQVHQPKPNNKGCSGVEERDLRLHP